MIARFDYSKRKNLMKGRKINVKKFKIEVSNTLTYKPFENLGDFLKEEKAKKNKKEDKQDKRHK